MPLGFEITPTLPVQGISTKRERATNLIPKRNLPTDNAQHLITPIVPLVTVAHPVSSFATLAPTVPTKCLQKFALNSTSPVSSKVLSTFQEFARTEFGLDLSMWAESIRLQFQNSGIRSVFFDPSKDNGLVLSSRAHHGITYRPRNLADMKSFIRDGYSTSLAYNESLGISGFSFGGFK